MVEAEKSAPTFLLIHLVGYCCEYGNDHGYPASNAHISFLLSGYETGQTAANSTIVVPFNLFSKAQRDARQKPQSVQSASIRHALLLNAPSRRAKSAGASCGSLSITRLVCGNNAAISELMIPWP